MKKNFTKAEIVKCHETNIKAASSLYLLAGALCAVYIVRFFITKNFDFYFSLAFSDMFLKLGASGEISQAAGSIVAIAFLLIYFIVGILAAKKEKLYPLMLVVYAADFICLLFCDFILWQKPESTDFLIDIICHIWVLLFVTVGFRSHRILSKETK